MARIAIIGTGISGLGAAWLLNKQHEITVYEKAASIGGHTRTVEVNYDGTRFPVDTGFIVFNRLNYPNLTALFELLQVPTHASNMTFGATIRDGWLEWGAQDLNAVFGQRRNILRPHFALLLRDIGKFNALAEATVARHPDFTLSELMDHLALGDWFRRFYLLPMTGAIWSCPFGDMLKFPAKTLVQFFANHRLLSVSGQPQWHTVVGGSREYIARLTPSFQSRIRTNCGVDRVTRDNGKVQIRDVKGGSAVFDEVIMACHGDEALAILGDAKPEERAVLSAFRYQTNVAVLHRDIRVMPKRRRCWSSWIYASDGEVDHPKITVTYWMNRLQSIDKRFPLFVSLNPKREIDPTLVFDTHEFQHPVFDKRAIAAQGEIQALQGRDHTWFAGAHLRYGFHEDGLLSAVNVARALGSEIPWSTGDQALPLRSARRT